MNIYNEYRNDLVFKNAEAEIFLSIFEKDKVIQNVAKCMFVDGLTAEETAIIMAYSKRQIERFRLRIMTVAVKRLMKKQIPQKPNFRKGDKKVFAECPNCKTTLTYKEKIKANFWKLSHCYDCGQALDWSDSE